MDSNDRLDHMDVAHLLRKILGLPALYGQAGKIAAAGPNPPEVIANARKALADLSGREGPVADQLRETPERSSRWIAKMLGVDNKTVLSVRGELQSGEEFPHLDRIMGQDGRCYPSSLDRAEEGLPPVNHERYTPAALVDAVREVLGGIDLDPASSKAANEVVRAKSFFTVQSNGLKRRWRGRVFLNPPFDDWPTWLTKLDRELEAGRVREAVVVGPANISAFRPLLQRGALLWVPDERPKYYDPHADKLIDPPFGSLVGYVGRKRDRFLAVFGARGLVLQAARCR